MLNKKEIAAILLEVKAVHLSPNDLFTWASGIKSPIYCDNRQLISYPTIRKKIIQSFCDHIKQKFPNVTYIAGTATAGIPHAAWIAHELELPMIYVRSNNKSHGMQNAIEGHIVKNEKIILVEDLFSTGGSSVQAADCLSLLGHQVLEIVSIFTYGLEKAKTLFESKGYRHHSLCDIAALLEIAQENQILTNEEAIKVSSFLRTI